MPLGTKVLFFNNHIIGPQSLDPSDANSNHSQAHRSVKTVPHNVLSDRRRGSVPMLRIDFNSGKRLSDQDVRGKKPITTRTISPHTQQSSLRIRRIPSLLDAGTYTHLELARRS